MIFYFRAVIWSKTLNLKILISHSLLVCKGFILSKVLHIIYSHTEGDNKIK